MVTFHEFLRRVRDVVGLTQQNVADALGLDRSTYSYYETGKTEPNIRGLKILAKLYNLTIDDLVYCRYRPIDTTLRAEEPPERPLTDLAQLRNLTREEQMLVLLYRKTWDKEALLQHMRAFEDHDPVYDEQEPPKAF